MKYIRHLAAARLFGRAAKIYFALGAAAVVIYKLAFSNLDLSSAITALVTLLGLGQ